MNGHHGHDDEPLVQLRRSGERIAPADPTRRDVLSLMGFSLGAAGLAGCRAPVQYAIPLPVAAEDLTPGVARHYATTCGGCPSACALLVKQRDGRPIKIEGNDESPLFGGGTCATGQATVLSLYDDARLRGPIWDGQSLPWSELDRHVVAGLEAARAEGRQIVLLTSTTTSPSMQKILQHWSAAFPTFRHVVYDAVSASALRAAHLEGYGKAIVPHYRFDRARVIVGLDADFLGTWLSPVEFAHQYARGRTVDARRSFHAQCEAGVSVTGSNADVRLVVPPSSLGAVAVALLAGVVRRLGLPELEAVPSDLVAPLSDGASEKLAVIEDALWRHRGESLVVCGTNDLATQTIVAALNALLGNVGVGADHPVDVGAPSLQRQGDDAELERLVADMNAGLVHTLVMHGVNPVYDAPAAGRFLEGLENVPLSIPLADRADETGAHVRALCPDHHFLESWGDAEPVQGQLSLTQPLIAPLFDTRAAAESLLAWAGRPADHHTFLRAFWRRSVFPHQDELATFETFWERALERGTATLRGPRATPLAELRADWRRAARTILDERAPARLAGRSSAYELHLHESVALRDGRHANNPWLQELPDPITKLTWGNVAAVAPKTAAALGLENGDVVTLAWARGRLELPVFIQPGQDARTISVALGYGRARAGRAGDGVGVNAFALTEVVAGARRTSVEGVTIVKTGRRETLASTQTHQSMEGRPIVLETWLDGRGEPAEPSVKAGELPSLWAERPEGVTGHRWGMAVDLDKCTGCSACLVACQSENNVPVVGKDQIQRGRAMHWIRIDRYYGDGDDAPTLHQPMMCQHCGHAPCETVCPVVATTTSSEGLNQQVYNRCIGTRYCANNCPYKVRRFNWYDYGDNDKFVVNLQSPLARLALNPDVTVRTRGVMEKCSLCVQRIHQGKSEAQQRRAALADGDIRTACQQVCPTGAIVFGDVNDPASRVSRQLDDRRAYRVLEELGTRPNVGYLKKVRA